MVFKMTVGSKRQVYNGTAEHTSGYLYKSELFYNKRGRIVSKIKHKMGKELYKKYKDELKPYQYK